MDKRYLGRSLRGNVDRNVIAQILLDEPIRRSLRGNVDRNFERAIHVLHVEYVVPYVGTWIEICYKGKSVFCYIVVPYVGTWIEMLHQTVRSCLHRVVPYVGTWIEIFHQCLPVYFSLVVPYVGTWIEMYPASPAWFRRSCRSLRGNVDRNIFRKTLTLQMSWSFPTWERG